MCAKNVRVHNERASGTPRRGPLFPMAMPPCQGFSVATWQCCSKPLITLQDSAKLGGLPVAKVMDGRVLESPKESVVEEAYVTASDGRL